MSRDDGFLAFLQELLEPMGRIALRPMSGGHGVYCDEVFIAIVAIAAAARKPTSRKTKKP